MAKELLLYYNFGPFVSHAFLLNIYIYISWVVLYLREFKYVVCFTCTFMFTLPCRPAVGLKLTITLFSKHVRFKTTNIFYRINMLKAQIYGLQRHHVAAIPQGLVLKNDGDIIASYELLARSRTR